MPQGGSSMGHVSWGPNPARPYKDNTNKAKTISAFNPLGKKKANSKKRKKK